MHLDGVFVDSTGNATLTLGGGTVVGAGSLSPSLSISGNTFTVTTLGYDSNTIEFITVSGSGSTPAVRRPSDPFRPP